MPPMLATLAGRLRQELAEARSGLAALTRIPTILRGADLAWHMLVQGGLVIATPKLEPMLMSLVQPDGDIILRADRALVHADEATRAALSERHGAELRAALMSLRVSAAGARDLFAGAGVLQRVSLAGSGVWGAATVPWSTPPGSTLSGIAFSNVVLPLLGPALVAIGGWAMLLLRHEGVRLLRWQFRRNMRAMQKRSGEEAQRLQAGPP